MALTTRSKILLASACSAAILFFRRCAGLAAEGVFRRGGFCWKLDLHEGVDFAIFLLGSFEWRTRLACERRLVPGAIVFDVGANIGAHTLPLARSVGSSGKVYAFEATAYAVRRLQENLSLNTNYGKRVEVVHALLTDGEERREIQALHSRWPLAGAPESHRHPEHGGALEAIGTDSQFSLDQFAEKVDLARLDLIKIDVDGHELAVLKGALRLLQRWRPLVVLELAPSYAEGGLDLLLEFFWNLGYEFSPLGRSRFLPHDAKALQRAIPKGGSMNVMAIPVLGESP